MCDRGKNRPHNSEDCHDVAASSPIVMNRLNQFRICGKRGGKSFFEMVRPIKVQQEEGGSERPYECPEGYRACNDEWLDDFPTDGQDYVVCIENGASFEENCPITSFIFDT